MLVNSGKSMPPFFYADEFDELLADLAAQVPGFRAVGGTGKSVQFQAAVLPVGDLQTHHATSPIDWRL